METFFSIFISIDGILVKEALVVITNFSSLVAVKMEEPILHMRGWIYSWIEIAVTRSYSHMIFLDHLPIPLQDREPDWELASGLG